MLSVAKTSKFGVFSLACPHETITPTELPSYQKEKFDEIFSTVSYDRAKNASLDARSVMTPIEKIGLTYGEVKFTAMQEIFNILRNENKELFTSPGGKFYDLGSGSGRPVIMAALLHNFSSCIGIEIIPQLDILAKEALVRWNRYSEHNEATKHVDFVLGSITDLSCCDWTDGDIVFTNSTAFSDALFAQVAQLATAMKPGALFVSLTADIRDSLNFEIVGEVRLEMSWGMADVYVHRRLGDALK